MSNAHQPHDKIFKKAFSDKEVTIDYLNNFLPPELLSKLRINEIRLEQQSFLDDRLKDYYADLIYSCPYGKDREIIVSLLFEHKSNKPTYPHIQLLRYLLEAYDVMLKQKEKLRVLIPIVVYHGKKEWKYRTFDSFFKGIDEGLKKFIPNFDYLLTDLSKLTDAEIIGMKAGLLLNILLLLKHSKEEAYIRKNFSQLFYQVEAYLDNEQKVSLVRSMLVYVLETTEISKKEIGRLTQESEEELKQLAMTTAQLLRQEGRAEERAKFEAELESMIVDMLKDGILSIQQIAKYCKVETSYILQIKSRLK